MTGFLPRSLAALGVTLAISGSAWGQARIQFPSPLEGAQTAPAPATGAAGSAANGSSTYAQPNVGAGSNLQPIPQAPQGTPPAQGTTSPRIGAPYAQPNSTYGQPSVPPTYAPGQVTPYGQAPGYAPAPAPNQTPGYGQPYNPGAVSPYAPDPGAYGGVAPPGWQSAPVGPLPGGPYGGVSGAIQSPPPYWDPYAPPGSQPPAILPQDPYLPYTTPDISWQTAQRFLQEARLDYVWLVGHGPDEFGANDVEMYGTFALPFFRNTQTPLLVTPGFAVHFWEGPATEAPEFADMPANAYDAYLEGAWNPQVTPTFGGELAFRVGVYSDFQRIIDESIRYQGKGLGVLSLSPNVKVKAGAWYIDRNYVKLLPAGGVVWTPQGPDGNMKFDILFPNPKLAFRLSNYRSTEWWIYARGEYGGGAWTIKRTAPPVAGQMDQVDYNDLRASVGLEFIRPSGFSGLFETGISFDREIRYVSNQPTVFRPKPTVFLRGSVAY